MIVRLLGNKSRDKVLSIRLLVRESHRKGTLWLNKRILLCLICLIASLCLFL